MREAAVEGCCRCLLYFWEIIPAATSAKIIGDITGRRIRTNVNQTVLNPYSCSFLGCGAFVIVVYRMPYQASLPLTAPQEPSAFLSCEASASWWTASTRSQSLR